MTTDGEQRKVTRRLFRQARASIGRADRHQREGRNPRLVDLVLPDPDDGGEPTAQRCPRTGRQILEFTELGHPRVRVVCAAHGLDTAPTDHLVDEDTRRAPREGRR